MKRFAVPRSEGGSEIHYVLYNDRAMLVWATNLADIEKHSLLAGAPDLNRPTSLVFDLDPGERREFWIAVAMMARVKAPAAPVFSSARDPRHHATDGGNGLPADRLVGVRHFAYLNNSTATAASGMESATRIVSVVTQNQPVKVEIGDGRAAFSVFVKLVNAN